MEHANRQGCHQERVKRVQKLVLLKYTVHFAEEASTPYILVIFGLLVGIHGVEPNKKLRTSALETRYTPSTDSHSPVLGPDLFWPQAAPATCCSCCNIKSNPAGSTRGTVSICSIPPHPTKKRQNADSCCSRSNHGTFFATFAWVAQHPLGQLFPPSGHQEASITGTRSNKIKRYQKSTSTQQLLLPSTTSEPFGGQCSCLD